MWRNGKWRPTEIPRVLVDNLGLKGISLLLAFLLWLSVSSEQVIERTVSAPLEFLNSPPQLEISNDYVRNVDVQISTRRRALAAGASNISAVVDLRDARAGERIIPVTERDIRKPDGVTVLNITPSRITLILERSLSKLVPVETHVVGTPAKGYQVTQARATPGEILITGPESRVRKVFRAVTEPIQVAGVRSSIRHDVYVDVADSKLRIDRVNPIQVDILIEEERVMERVAVPLLAGPGVRTATRTVQLQVSYPKTYRGAVRPSLFTAIVEKPSDGASGEEREVAPRVVLGRQVEKIMRVDRVSPEKVKVRIL